MVYSNTDTTIELVQNYHKNNIETDATRYNDENPEVDDICRKHCYYPSSYQFPQ